MSEAPETPQDAEPPVKPVLTPSQAKRANQSLKGMIISVLLTVAVAIPVIALNPHSTENNYKPDVDVSTVAHQASQAADFTPAAPDVPEGWYPNFARWNSGTADKIDFWEIGYVTGGEGFVWLRQTGDATPGWIAKITDDAPATGSTTVDGATWDVYAKGAEHTWARTAHGSTVLLSSDSGDELLEQAARAVMKDQDSATRK